MLNKWNEVQINKQHIIYKNERSYLIKAPNKSEYKNYIFWVSEKLIKAGRNKNTLTLSFKENFKFTFIKKDKRYREIDRKIVDALELFDIFNYKNDNVDYNLTNSYCRVLEPEKIEINRIEILNEFKN